MSNYSCLRDVLNDNKEVNLFNRPSSVSLDTIAEMLDLIEKGGFGDVSQEEMFPYVVHSLAYEGNNSNVVTKFVLSVIGPFPDLLDQPVEMINQETIANLAFVIARTNIALSKEICNTEAALSFRNCYGETILHYLAQRINKPDIFELFEESFDSNGIFIRSLADKNNNTILHSAAKSSDYNINIVRYLIANYSDLLHVQNAQSKLAKDIIHSDHINSSKGSTFFIATEMDDEGFIPFENAPGEVFGNNGFYSIDDGEPLYYGEGSNPGMEGVALVGSD